MKYEVGGRKGIFHTSYYIYFIYKDKLSVNID